MSDDDIAKRIESTLTDLGAEHGFSRVAEGLSKACDNIAEHATKIEGQGSPLTVVWKSAGNLFKLVKGVEDAR